MGQTRRHTILAATGLVAALGSAQIAGGAMVFSDAAAFDAALHRLHIDWLESIDSGLSPQTLRFDGALTATIAVEGALEHRIVEGSDGHGAVAADGGRFWKLRGGTATFTLNGAAVNAFGFHYSDLENARLQISAAGHVFQPMELTDSNAHTNHFIGVIADAPLTSVSITWLTAQGDGIGLDGIRFGATAAIPTPQSMTLGIAGMAMYAIPRRRR